MNAVEQERLYDYYDAICRATVTMLGRYGETYSEGIYISNFDAQNEEHLYLLIQAIFSSHHINGKPIILYTSPINWLRIKKTIGIDENLKRPKFGQKKKGLTADQLLDEMRPSVDSFMNCHFSFSNIYDTYYKKSEKGVKDVTPME